MRFALLFLLMAAPVAAEFTAEEKASVAVYVDGVTELSTAFNNLGRYASGAPEDMTPVWRYGRRLLTARRYAVNGLLVLLDKNQSSPRSGQIADGKRMMERGRQDVDSVVELMVRDCPDDCRIVIANAEAASAKMSRFNGDLAYLEPRLDENLAMITPDGEQAYRSMSPAIGPHGLYRFNTQFAFQFNRDVDQTAGAFLDAFEDHVAELEAELPDYEDRRLVLREMGSHVADFHFHTALLMTHFALVPGLAVGVVPDGRHADDIESMRTFGTSTSRGDGFWFFLKALELLGNRTDRGPDQVSVDGHKRRRGSGYDMRRDLQEVRALLRKSPGLSPDTRDRYVQVMELIGRMWMHTDAWMVEAGNMLVRFHVGPVR